MRHIAMLTRFAPLLCVLVLMTVPVLAAEGAKPSSGASLAQADEAIEALRWSDAVSILKKLVAADPDWRAFRKLGHAQFNLGQFQDAIDAFTSAIDLAKAAPDDPATRLAIAQMLTEQGNVY